jgi:hypothetical protein
MDYVHRCVICDWQREAASPTVTAPRCENCGCALESVRAHELALAQDTHLAPALVRLPAGLVRLAGLVGGALLMFAAARAGYAEGGPAIAVAAVGVAGLVVVTAMVPETA